MKKVIITIACLSMGVFAAKAQNSTTTAPSAHPAAPAPQATAATVPDEKAGKFKFQEETHDYGQVPEGPTAEYDFEFKNVGKKPIVITEAHGSCGCTVPKWPKDPVMPGKKGTIHVTYNTAGRPGAIQKDIIINSNAQQSPMILHIRGTVTAKAAVPATPPADKKG